MTFTYNRNAVAIQTDVVVLFLSFSDLFGSLSLRICYLVSIDQSEKVTCSFIVKVLLSVGPTDSAFDFLKHFTLLIFKVTASLMVFGVVYFQ